MMQMMHFAFLASPPLKHHLQHNLKKSSLEAPSSPNMCRINIYCHFLGSRSERKWRLDTRSSKSTKCGAMPSKSRTFFCCHGQVIGRVPPLLVEGGLDRKETHETYHGLKTWWTISSRNHTGGRWRKILNPQSILHTNSGLPPG